MLRGQCQFLITVFCLPSFVLLYTDQHNKKTWLSEDDPTINDDFIIPHPHQPCPDLSLINCSEEPHSISRRQVLIFANTKVTTTRPLATTTRAMSPSSSDHSDPCNDDDDEDCAQSGDHDPDLDPNSNDHNFKPPTSPPPPLQHQTKPLQPQETTRLDSFIVSDNPNPTEPDIWNEVPPLNEQEPNSQYNSMDTYVPPNREESRPVHQLPDPHFSVTFNMNIILIVGIATGVVILLLILIVAVFMYNGRTGSANKAAASKLERYGGMGAGPPAPTGQKSYAYEACNAYPPQNELYPTNFGSYSPPQVDITSAHTLSPVKPSNKRDVKEWYV